VSNGWPANWDRLITGQDCEMCAGGRPDQNQYGIRIRAGQYTDAYLQRANIQRGYTLVIWRGRHVNEPTELTDEEAGGYWAEVLIVARALISYYDPLKMNYETLGNSVPHLHTHLVPRYRRDPAPGQPFPLLPQTGAEAKVPNDRLEQEAQALRDLLFVTA
jgi:diadenosine tetraphosphate (Ap4A) HIT family hydrolase